MIDNLQQFIEAMDGIVPVTGVIGVYWDSTSKCWRIQMDEDAFLREIEIWDENKAPGRPYPYALVELVANRGNVEVFCLVKDLPA